ncbi:MAG: DUF5343 domain-containing protein [Actinomycetota bacterium]
MADEPARASRSYPYLPSKNWWDLRRKFQQTMPQRVDAGYLQTVLDVGEGHARNLIPQLRQIGLIDDNNRTTPLANDWRDDETYAQACRQIVDRVYPQDLTDALPPPNPDPGAAARWFMRTLGVGQSAATKLASFYRLVASGDVAGQQTERRARETSGNGAKRSTAKRQTAQPRTRRATASGSGTGTEAATVERKGTAVPSLHIDVQVHIPPDATPEQIDIIFAAMAKHLYDKR